jgi:hypothetical protein
MPTIKAHARITGEARARLSRWLVRQYERGESIRALAGGTGRSYGFVHRVLSDSDVTLRGRGGSHPRRTEQA